MVEYKAEAPIKVLIEDLKNFKKSDTTWTYKVTETDTITNINKILIQGEIIKTAGFSKEILIVDDKTGKIKVTRKSHVPGDLSWLSDGEYCSVIGRLSDNGKLPLLAADKIARITNFILLEMWPLEVKELRGVLTKKITPTLQEDDEVLFG